MSESKTSEKRLAAMQRQQQALGLRTAGHGFEEIARRLGYKGPSGAYGAIRSALQRTLREPADELRTLEIERLDAMLAAIWPGVLAGKLFAIDRALAIQERRARYLGLDAPKKIDVETRLRLVAEQLGMDPDAAVAEAQRIVRQTKGKLGAGAG